jgi:hypothetical protein
VTSGQKDRRKMEQATGTNEMHLGNRVYVEIINGRIKLSVEYGAFTSNTIYLNVDVWNNLLEYVDAKLD